MVAGTISGEQQEIVLRSLRTVVLTLFFLSLALAFIGGVLWANLRFAQTQPGGVEFVQVWRGGRGFLMDGLSPYSDVTTSAIQMSIYQRLARASEPAYRVNVPFYTQLLFLPFGSIDNFTTARALWMLLLEAMLMAAMLVSLALLRWRPRAWLLGLIFIFGLLWAHAVLPLVNGSLAIIAALLYVGVLSALLNEADELAGALLALASFKLEVGLPFILLIFIWAAANRRWRVLYGFLMLTALMIVIATLLLPAWPMQFLRAAVATMRSGPLITTYALFAGWWPGLGDKIAWALTALVIGLLLVEWNAARKRDLRWLTWTAGLTLVLTPLSGLPAQPVNYIAMLMPVILIFHIMDERWGALGRFTLIAFMLILFILPWTIALANPGDENALFFVLPLLITPALYWIRWWAVRPPRTVLDTLPRTF
jgi:hypothetical protein